MRHSLLSAALSTKTPYHSEEQALRQPDFLGQHTRLNMAGDSCKRAACVVFCFCLPDASVKVLPAAC